ncbi:MAG: hypothetical protein M9894_08440 [Planctomycetes bacterium]|nr:hypothetical protein [Planctomycetota bacterium]
MTPEPAASEPAGRSRGATRLTFDVQPPADGLARGEDGVYTSRPRPTSDWERAGLFDRERRALPLAVRWTCAAEVARDASGLADWERGHGFREAAGFFYELGVRAAGHPIEAARQLEPGAWWVTLQVRRDGRVLGLVRVVNRDKPPGADLVHDPPPGQPRTPGVEVLERFELRPRPAEPLVLDLRVDVAGWGLKVHQDGRPLLSLARAWSEAALAPLSDELRRGVFLWGHLGNWSDGHGVGTLAVDLLGPGRE